MIIIMISHTKHILTRIHVIGTFSKTGPAEIGLHLMLMSPFMTQSPYCITVIFHNGITVQHTWLLIIHKGNAIIPLKHIIGIVYICTSTVFRHPIIFIKAQQMMFPTDECIQNIHKLHVTFRCTVNSLTVVSHSGNLPDRMNFLAYQVNATILSIHQHSIQFSIITIWRQVTIDGSVDKVYLYRRRSSFFFLAICEISDISQSIIIRSIINDIESILKGIRILSRPCFLAGIPSYHF